MFVSIGDALLAMLLPQNQGEVSKTTALKSLTENYDRTMKK
jgi:hypothetical protein